MGNQMMKSQIAFLFLFSSWMANAAFGQGLQATILNVNGETTPGFVIGADKEGILVSTTADGATSFKLPFQNIKDYNMEEPKGWSAALAVYQSGNYAEAEKQFETLGQSLEKLVPLRDSFGSMAKYYHFSSLQKQGKFKELAAVFERQLANPLSLNEGFQEDIQDLQGWTIVGKQDWVALMAYLQGFEDKAAKGSLPQAPFKKASRSRLSSLSFMRALLEEHDGKKELALLDYHGALTLNLGSDASLTAQAAKSALRLTDELLQQKPDHTQLKRQAYALAVIYRDLSAKGQLPPELAKLAEKPAEPAVSPEPEKK